DAKTGKVSIKPLTAAEVAQINDLVREAMGFNKERGDTMNVTNAPFDGVDKPEDPPAVTPWWKDSANIEMAKEVGKFLLAAAVLLFLWFRFLSPMLRPLMRKLDKLTEEPAKVDGMTPEEIEVEHVREEQEAAVAVQVQTGYRDNLTMAKKLAAEDPRVVANVVKAWVGSNE
ncbi:MAG TPA: flagellar M-ring protein FliF C-terminal domain-containing protein, partial [Telluria sp.]|nr:flagellar M-ring protein FliF C-terminal domain-containing protein [Telluria sp.]